MCGRFSLSASLELLADAFQVTELPDLSPRYNIAPSQPVAVIRRMVPGAPRRLDLLSWGLLPAWAKDAKAARPINARADTVAEKPTFRAAFRNRRCLVPADAFFEWQQQGTKKQPFCFRMADHGLFALAGLWERWEGPEEQVLETFSLLTTEPNELVATVHDRMPVILRPDQYDRWLDPTLHDPASVLAMTGPYPASAMVAYAVDPKVGSPAFDTPECLVPVEPKGQLSLF